MHKILVNVMREEIRMAVIDEEGQLVDFVLERTDESHMANHMYKGTVKNVLNGMQAAFVDIGGSQNAYLNLQQGKEQKILQHLMYKKVAVLLFALRQLRLVLMK